MYGNDYDDISSIKRIADEHDISIILVHHLRKLKDGDDPFNEVSGSTGITGAADTNYVLKRKRSSRDATLLACGRDVEYQELTLRFQDLKWELVEHKNTEEIRKAEILQFLFSGSGIYEIPHRMGRNCHRFDCRYGGNRNHAQCGNQVFRTVFKRGTGTCRD